jgi:hypothetical protein
MILPQPPVATFVQDDSTRPPVVSAQMGYRARKKAPSAGTSGGDSPPNSPPGDQPTQNTGEYCHFAPSHLSSFKNKPQRKISFRLTH